MVLRVRVDRGMRGGFEGLSGGGDAGGNVEHAGVGLRYSRLSGSLLAEIS